MSLGISISIGLGDHRSRGSGGGGSSVPALALGMNLNWLTYWTSQGVCVDLVGTQDGITCVGTGFNTTGNTTSGSYTVSGIASMANITVGMGVTGTGIDQFVTVTAVNVGGSSVTLSRPATATGTGVALSFSFNSVQVPDAYLDANGYPNAYPPGITAFRIILNQSVTSQQHVMTWQGSLTNPTFGNVFSGVGTVSGNSITVTPAALQAGRLGQCLRHEDRR